MKNIYKRIGNPLVEDGMIDEIIDAYTDNYNLYAGLVKSEDKIKARYNIKDRDDFYLFLFNDWKYTIERIREANYLKEPYKSKMIKLDNYLRSQNPSSTDEVIEILRGKKTQDNEIKELIETFRWNRLGEYSSWEHIDSSYIRLGLHNRQKIEHRLYINCDSNKTHLIIRKLIEKCKENKLSYYFKYDPYGDRADTIVIYCDTTNLPNYVRILNSIIKEEDLTSTLHRPPLLTGKINPYIGYGSEPQDINGKATSFNAKREKHIEKCIREVTSEFVKENLGRRMTRNNGEKITYKDYLIDSIIACLRERTLKYMTGTDDDKKRRGYREKEVKSSFFDITLINALSTNIDRLITAYQEGNNSFYLEIPFSQGKITLSGILLEEIFKKQIKHIFRKTKSYKTKLDTKLKSTAHEFDIDKDNYSVDLSKCALLGKGIEEEVRQINPSDTKQNDDKPKVNKKTLNYKPMTDEEIEEARRKLGFKK